MQTPPPAVSHIRARRRSPPPPLAPPPSSTALLTLFLPALREQEESQSSASGRRALAGRRPSSVHCPCKAPLMFGLALWGWAPRPAAAPSYLLASVPLDVPLNGAHQFSHSPLQGFSPRSLLRKPGPESVDRGNPVPLRHCPAGHGGISEVEHQAGRERQQLGGREIGIALTLLLGECKDIRGKDALQERPKETESGYLRGGSTHSQRKHLISHVLPSSNAKPAAPPDP